LPSQRGGTNASVKDVTVQLCDETYYTNIKSRIVSSYYDYKKLYPDNKMPAQ